MTTWCRPRTSCGGSRIVGDKPITALLAQMFIDDAIPKRK
jgi:hypothetical protein